MSTYTAYQPESVYDDDCPCANSDEGYDERCEQHSLDHRSSDAPIAPVPDPSWYAPSAPRVERHGSSTGLSAAFRYGRGR